MGLFDKVSLFVSEKKREDLVVFLETEFNQLQNDYLVSLDFLESNKDINGFDVMIKDIKVEYVTALVFLKDEIEKNIQLLRERVDKINKNTRWMKSKQSVENMDGLNRTIGKLMALSDRVENSKKLINAEKDSNSKEIEQPAGPQ